MDRSLWLLLRLRVVGWFRRRGRGLRTLKGLALAMVGSILFLPMLVSVFFAPRIMIAAQLGVIRRYGPLALLAYCVLNVVLSSGDRSIYYSPAEVNFLFSGPYRPRQLLIYKVVGGVAAALVTALLMTFAFAHHAALFVSAFTGLFLSLELIYLFSLAVGLAAGTFGALAYSRGRKAFLAALGVVAAGAVWPIGRSLMVLPFAEVVFRALRSPGVAVVLAPFRPFVMAFTAERAWPDLAVWSALGAAIDLALLFLILALNAGFLEASASASLKLHERLQRARRGDPWVSRKSPGAGLPMLPWLWGVGPNLWRQLTAAWRSPTQLVALVVLFLLPVASIVVRGGSSAEGQGVAQVLPMFLMIALFAQSSVNHDFRADLRRMEVLKTLPIRPTSLALGQLLTPVLILTAAGWLSLAAVARVDPTLSAPAAGAAAVLMPMNLILVAVENVYFLWFPYRTVGVNSFDLQAIGRQMLLMMAKLAGVAVAGSVAAGAGALVYLFAGESWVAAVATATIVTAGFGLSLLPVVARAFEQFNVADGVAE